MLFFNKFETPNKTNIYNKYFTFRSSEGKIIIKIIKKEGDKIRGHSGDQNLRCLDFFVRAVVHFCVSDLTSLSNFTTHTQVESVEIF